MWEKWGKVKRGGKVREEWGKVGEEERWGKVGEAGEMWGKVGERLAKGGEKWGKLGKFFPQ
jgi:uncharacterized protein YjbJ (UPF0337 family)